MNNITYDARIYKTDLYRGKTVLTYYVRWKVGTKLWKKAFRKKAQADSFQAELLGAARRGEAFSVATGEPVAWGREDKPEMSWYDFACAYTDMKWKDASAKHRASIAYVLTLATPAMLASAGKPCDDREFRTALRRWGFNPKARSHCPPNMASVLGWVARSTLPVSKVAEPAITRHVLNTATSKLDGKRAAASTVRRHRAILSNAMEYAVELGLLDSNPMKDLNWTPAKTAFQVDRRCVVNPRQARELLEAVRAWQPSGPRLVTFFALVYFAGLRPEEAVTLRWTDVTWPSDGGAWGELHLSRATPDAGREWTDSGEQRDERGLKHRADTDTRPVPCAPELAAILRNHLDAFGEGPDGRVIHGTQGGVLATSTYRRVWDQARKDALTSEEHRSPLAKRVYDLRHACLSTWLNAGVPAKQVAEWAGNSVEVLLRTYAKCLVGQDAIALGRISEALGQTSSARVRHGQPPSTAVGRSQPDTAREARDDETPGQKL